MEFTGKDISLYLGFLTLEICLDNANRAGKLWHMRRKEFEEVPVAEDGSAQIWVSRHKTDSLYGQSPLYLNPQLLKYLRIYSTIIRPKLAPQRSSFFLNSKGQKLFSSDMRKNMQQMWKFCGMEGQVVPSLIRKASTTSVHKAHPELVDKLARKMNHTVATARRHYALHDKLENAITVGKQLRKIMIGSNKN